MYVCVTFEVAVLTAARKRGHDELPGAVELLRVEEGEALFGVVRQPLRLVQHEAQVDLHTM